MPGEEPGTFRDPDTGALYMLPSVLGSFNTVGPVSRDEFNGLVERVDVFAAQIKQQFPDRVAAMEHNLARYIDEHRDDTG